VSLLLTTTTSHKSSFLFVGLQRKNVDEAITKIRDLYQAHSSTKTFTHHDLADLTQDDRKSLMNLVETQGLYVQEDPYSQGGLTVSGLKAGVNQVEQMLRTVTPLRREMRVKDEETLYPNVAWCILGQNDSWERLPKTANYNLENQNITKGIVDAQGLTWSVNLLQMEAKRNLSRQTAKLKRLENLPVSYSNPAADGTQTMFVARVLTGRYTPGRSDMRVPPPRNSQQPYDRYDSLVDRMDNPAIFIVFHDSQAYPDYLITFH
ncbi:hypothetical protein GOODEAATRI_009997, partial [Goodea atripinnis]